MTVSYCGACATSLFKLVKPCGEWATRGLCQDWPVDVFFPENDGVRPSYALALEICGECPVRAECLEHALDTRVEYGVWGGVTPAGRRRMLREGAGV